MALADFGAGPAQASPYGIRHRLRMPRQELLDRLLASVVVLGTKDGVDQFLSVRRQYLPRIEKCIVQNREIDTEQGMKSIRIEHHHEAMHIAAIDRGEGKRLAAADDAPCEACFLRLAAAVAQLGLSFEEPGDEAVRTGGKAIDALLFIQLAAARVAHDECANMVVPGIAGRP
jgi:hypothetical protein